MGIERATSMVATWVEVGTHPKDPKGTIDQLLTVEHFSSGEFPAWLVRGSEKSNGDPYLSSHQAGKRSPEIMMDIHGGNPWVKR